MIRGRARKWLRLRVNYGPRVRAMFTRGVVVVHLEPTVGDLLLPRSPTLREPGQEQSDETYFRNGLV